MSVDPTVWYIRGMDWSYSSPIWGIYYNGEFIAKGYSYLDEGQPIAEGYQSISDVTEQGLYCIPQTGFSFWGYYNGRNWVGWDEWKEVRDDTTVAYMTSVVSDYNEFLTRFSTNYK